MDWKSAISLIGFLIALGSFLRLDWYALRYFVLRFAEYPEITKETPPTHVALFIGECQTQAFFGLVCAVGMAAMTYVFVTTPIYPFRMIAVIESVVAGFMFLFSSLNAVAVQRRLYLRAFPLSLLDEQLERRGVHGPKELKHRKATGP